MTELTDLPRLPRGYAYVVDDEGRYVLDDEGRFVIAQADPQYINANRPLPYVIQPFDGDAFGRVYPGSNIMGH